MKKTLLLFSLFGIVVLNPFRAIAQEFPNTLTIFDEAVFYGMYGATVDDTHPVPPGSIRNSNSSYGYKLTEDQIASIGNKLTMTVTLRARCDNYDRIGNVNLAFVPKGQTTYDYNEVKKIELGRYITPFMNMHIDMEVPYVFEIDNVAQILHDEELASEYDFWIEFEVYGYQGGPGQGGAAVEIEGCSDRIDVYEGKLELTTDIDPEIDDVPNFLLPFTHKYELKDYTLEGTDVLGETVRTIGFTVTEEITNARFYIITSNHGANNGGEEYIRRNHFIYLDEEQLLVYKPGGVSCVPFFQYNTQPSCIYYDCSQNPITPRPDVNAAWSWNNWCPGDKIPIRVVAMGNLSVGEHSFKIDVPDAVFADDQGYFPMSVFLQGDSGDAHLEVKDFSIAEYSISPNPTSGIATINGNDAVKNVTVFNSLGQKVWEGKSNTIDMTSLQSGIYIATINFEGGKTATSKLVKN